MYIQYIWFVNNLTPSCLLFLTVYRNLSPVLHIYPADAMPIPYYEDRIRLDSYQNKGSDSKHLQAFTGKKWHLYGREEVWRRETKANIK